MMVTSALFFLTMGMATADAAPAAPPAETPAPPAKLPAGVVAIMDGKEITLDAYKEYLWRTMGAARLQEYLDSLLVEKSAKSLGITVSDEELSQKVDEEIQRQIESFFKGDVARWRSTLDERGWTEADYRAQRAAVLQSDLVRSKCVMKTRAVTDDAIRERFERDYGKGGVGYELRHVLVQTRQPGSKEESPEGEAKAREKAERILRELRDGADFGEMVSLYSDDSYTKKRGGVIPQYRPKMYGSDEFDAAVEKLTEPGQVSGIVKSKRGFHIVQLVSRKVTPFESVKEDIRKILTEEKPSEREKFDFVKKLRDEAKVVR
jgi:foldase protein PrsA